MADPPGFDPPGIPVGFRAFGDPSATTQSLVRTGACFRHHRRDDPVIRFDPRRVLASMSMRK